MHKCSAGFIFLWCIQSTYEHNARMEAYIITNNFISSLRNICPVRCNILFYGNCKIVCSQTISCQCYSQEISAACLLHSSKRDAMRAIILQSAVHSAHVCMRIFMLCLNVKIHMIMLFPVNMQTWSPSKYVFIYICVCVCIYICIYMYMYMHIYVNWWGLRA